MWSHDTFPSVQLWAYAHFNGNVLNKFYVALLLNSYNMSVDLLPTTFLLKKPSIYISDFGIVDSHLKLARDYTTRMLYMFETHILITCRPHAD